MTRSTAGARRDDLAALGLRDAAGNADQHLAAVRGARLLQVADAAKLRIDLFGRLLANMAGVQQDEVGILHRVRSRHSRRRQRIGHALAVVDIHLTAIGLDEDLLSTGV